MVRLYRELSLEEKADYGKELLEELTQMILQIKNKPVLLYSLLEGVFQKLHYAKELGLNITKYWDQIQEFQETIIISDIQRKTQELLSCQDIREFSISSIETAYTILSRHGWLNKQLEIIFMSFQEQVYNGKILFQIRSLASAENLSIHDYDILDQLIHSAIEKNILTDELKELILW